MMTLTDVLSQSFSKPIGLQASGAADAQPAEGFPFDAVLDAFVAGLCVLELSRGVRLMNRAAQDIVTRQDCLTLHDGCLSGVRADVTRRLDQALRLVCGQHATQDAFQIRSAGSSDATVHISVSGLVSARPAGTSVPSLALIVVNRLEAGGRAEAVLRSLFGLSHSEAAILNGLLTGKTLEQCAQSRGVAVSTARSQLKAIFAKTNTTSQAQLMVIANMLPATAPPGDRQSLRVT